MAVGLSVRGGVYGVPLLVETISIPIVYGLKKITSIYIFLPHLKKTVLLLVL